jgi:hypothetical protein
LSAGTDQITPRRGKALRGARLAEIEGAESAAIVRLKHWEKASEYMKVDAIGVLAKDKNGKVKQHKLGKQVGKKGMRIGVALGVIAAIPTGVLSLVGGVLGGGVIGEFFHKGLEMTDEDVARVGRQLDDGHAAVGVLTWDFETEAVTGQAQRTRRHAPDP